jgi:hypothetical protein
VPKFKFKSNGGRSELCRDFAGPNVKQYYNGIASFLKSGLNFNAEFRTIKSEAPMAFAVFFYLKDGDAVVQMEDDTFYNCADIKAVAVVPADNGELAGIQSCQLTNFCEVR